MQGYIIVFLMEIITLKTQEKLLKYGIGGLAIYGGIIGGILSGFVFCKVKKLNFMELADFCIPYVALCQSVGRWGNFINQEAHGIETNSFFKMGLYEESMGAYKYYHPTFLYESFFTLIIFFVLSYVYKSKKFNGKVFYLYFILYGLVRFFIEGLRTDSLYLGTTVIRISQLLSFILFFAFFVIFIKDTIKNKSNSAQ